MRIAFPSTTAALAVAASIAWPTTALALTDLILNVDCASGGRINQALSRPTLVDRRLVVVVSGSCTENVTIERDDVVLRAQGSGGGVSASDASKPAILINGARRVALEGLSVTGGLHGVLLTGGAAATIRGSAIRNAARTGVHIESGASAVVDASTIENHGQSGVTADGTRVTMTGSTVRGNGLSGVAALRGGSLFLGADNAGVVCCGNTIEYNAFDGVTLADSAGGALYGNTIQENGRNIPRFGILVTRASSLALRGGNLVRQNGTATGGGGIFVSAASAIRTGPGDTLFSPTSNEISGNTFGIQGTFNSILDLRSGVSVTGSTFTGVVVDTGARLRTDGSVITGNKAHGVFAARASSAEFVGSANVVSGNTAFGLFCQDVESSYVGNVGGISGNGQEPQVNCTGF